MKAWAELDGYLLVSGLDVTTLSFRRAVHVLLHVRLSNLDDKERSRVLFRLESPHWSDPTPDTDTDPNADLFANPAEGAAFMAAYTSGIGGID